MLRENLGVVDERAFLFVGECRPDTSALGCVGRVG
jgi:hypothetical protein